MSNNQSLLRDHVDIIDCLHSLKPKTVDKSDYIFLEVSNISNNGNLDLDNVKYISRDDYVNWTKRGKPFYGDLIITKTGRVGAVAYIDNDFNIAIGRNQVLLKAKESVYPLFLKYYFFSEEYQKSLKNLTMSGTILDSLHVKNIAKLKITIPAYEKQKLIANILNDFDIKIQINNKINRNLEELAQTLYKRWFVDFEFPNEEGKPYKSSGGEMVESELGLIPKGWEIVDIKEFTSKFTTGLNPRKNFVLGSGDNYYVTIKNLSNNQVLLNEKCDKINDAAISIINKRSQLKVGDILFSGIGTIGRVSYIDEHPHNWNISESLFSLRAKNSGDSYSLYALLLSHNLQNYVQSLSQGSAQRGIRKHDFEKYRFANNREILNDFNDLISSIYEKTFRVRKENLKLLELRDLLLPKLMSGEIEV